MSEPVLSVQALQYRPDAQTPDFFHFGAASVCTGRGAPAAPAAARAAFVRENYAKFECRVAMRDGVNLFTSVYVPKDVFTDGRTYPIMMQRTGCSVAPYGADLYRTNLGPSEFFEREKFTFVYQVRCPWVATGN